MANLPPILGAMSSAVLGTEAEPGFLKVLFDGVLPTSCSRS
jgi:hypothetical protein